MSSKILRLTNLPQGYVPLSPKEISDLVFRYGRPLEVALRVKVDSEAQKLFDYRKRYFTGSPKPATHVSLLHRSHPDRQNFIEEKLLQEASRQRP